MVSYHFHICGLHFALEAERELVTGGDMLPFFESAPPRPDLLIDCRTEATLPPLNGAQLKQDGEWALLHSGETVIRCRRNPATGEMYTRLAYTPAACDRVQLAVQDAAWRWATDHLRLWPTICLPQLLLPFRVLTFHASYIGTDGGAVLFTAPSQTGKSTQAALWERTRGARVLNGDKAAVRLSEVPTAHGLPFSGTSGICENVSLPLRCVVVLSQARENTARRLGATEALRLLAPNVFADMSVETEWRQTLSLLLDLVSAVPVYALACTPDEGAVCALEQAMAREEGQ